MGNKYILELEDKPFHKGNGDFLYRVKGFNSLVFDMTGIGKLTPYTEPDLDAIRNEAYEKGMQDRKKLWADAPRTCAYKLGYENGLNDAWEAARTLWNTPNRKEVFGHTTFNTVLTTLTAQETIEKIRQYEQEKEESEEPKKEQSVTAEEVMRQYLDAFCKRQQNCKGCPLNTHDFTCGRGRHFLTTTPVSDEGVRRAYAEVLRKMREDTNG